MKKVEAIIRKTRFEEVKEALHDVGIEFTCAATHFPYLNGGRLGRTGMGTGR